MNDKVEFVQSKFRRNSEIPKSFRAANSDESQRVNTLIEEHVLDILYSQKVSMMTPNEKHFTYMALKQKIGYNLPMFDIKPH